MRLLISGPLHSLMQPEIQRRCRHLDAITVKGSKLPLDIYTFDVGPLALKSAALAALLVPQNADAVTGSADHSQVDMPVHRSINLAGVAASNADSEPGEDADIPLDDEDRPLDPSDLPRRPSQIAADAEARAKRKKRGSTLAVTTKKIAKSIVGMFKHDPTSDARVHPAESGRIGAHGAQTTSPGGANGAAPPATPRGSDGARVKPKVENGDFTPSKLASLCAQLQLGLGDSFVSLFNEASSLYIKGHWARSRDVLEHKFLKLYPNDKPAKVLLNIMKETDFVKPSDWKGFRKLTSK